MGKKKSTTVMCSKPEQNDIPLNTNGVSERDTLNNQQNKIFMTSPGRQVSHLGINFRPPVFISCQSIAAPGVYSCLEAHV